jgi:Cys-tRNA(Pro)/Cys-tRNA(Cys) deacylase
MGSESGSSKLHKSVQDALTGPEVEYKVHDHGDLLSEISSPADFAAALGYPVQRIARTLFLRSHDRQAYAVAVWSADRRLNFKAAASAAGLKRVEAASPEELQAKTGYPRNGVSPLGLTGGTAVVVDSSLLGYETILIGGGVTAIEVELAPADLIRVTGATVADIS